MSLKIEHAHLVLPYQVLQDAWLISREGKITAYGCGVSPQQTFSTVVDAKGQYLTPGFVDLHVHGARGPISGMGKNPIFRKRSGARRMRRSSACRMRRNTSVFWSRPPACAAGPSPVNFPVR